MADKKPVLDAEDKKLARNLSRAELFARYLAIFTTIAGGLFWIYKDQEAKADARDKAKIAAAKEEAADDERRQLRQKEFQLGFFQKELELYLETCRITGTLATASDPQDEELAKIIDRFYTLYWGELSVVEDASVAQAMVRFEIALRKWQEKGGLATEEMRHSSYQLARKCRESIDGQFLLQRDKLPETRNEAAPIRAR